MINIKSLIKQAAEMLVHSESPETDAYELAKFVFSCVSKSNCICYHQSNNHR